MSLLDEYMTECVLQLPTYTSDGEGGRTATWTDGTRFRAAIVYDTSSEARIAEQERPRESYTVTTGREINLEFYNVFKRLSDGKMFRVTSIGTDNKTPFSAGINMRQVTAEEYKKP